MDSYHQDIRQRREQAEAAYAKTLTNLQEAQQNYNEPSGWYAKACARVRDLAGKLTASRTLAQQAHEQFQQRFADADFVVDKAARQALTQKSEAETVHAELERAIGIQDRQRQEALIPASQTGRTLMNCHASAWEAWTEMTILRALDEHGLNLVRAVARADLRAPWYRSKHGFDESVPCRQIALKRIAREIDAWARSLDADKLPEHGGDNEPQTPPKPELGPLGERDLLSHIAVLKAQRALAAQDRQQEQAQRDAQQVVKEAYLDRIA